MRWIGRVQVLGLSVVLTVASHAANHVLFDFEGGVGDWRVNVYGEGELTFEAAADAGPGQGSLGVRSRGLRGVHCSA